MNKQTSNDDMDVLNGEIKGLQANCVNSYLVIENAPPESPCTDENEITAKTNNYMEGLRTEVNNTNTLIVSNDKILTCQFLNELKEKITHIEELSCLTKSYIREQDSEIERLKSIINSTREAIMKPKRTTEDIKPEHVMKAREKFIQLKTEIHSLIECLFPDCHVDMTSLMGELMTADQESSYIPITSANYKLASMLKDMNIVTVNPYNDAEIKLVYF